MPGEAGGASPGGRHGSEDAGMSSERAARNRSAETQGFLGEANPQGQPGAKARPRGAADARRQTFRTGAGRATTDGTTGKDTRAGFWTSP